MMYSSGFLPSGATVTWGNVPDSYTPQTEFINLDEEGGFRGREWLEKNFQVSLPSSINILVAWYSQESYEGTAFVLFSKNGKLWEINAHHCSCYGLEGQWLAELALPAELRTREFGDAKKPDGSNSLKDHVIDALDKWEGVSHVTT